MSSQVVVRTQMLVASAVLGVLLAMAVVTFTDTAVPKDDSDPVGGRSGMAVRTDCLTGIQYLVDPRGGITPRLTVDLGVVVNTEVCK